MNRALSATNLRGNKNEENNEPVICFGFVESFFR